MSRTFVSGRPCRNLAIAVATVATASSLIACGGGSDQATAGSGVDNGTLQMYTWIGGEGDREQWQSYVDAGVAADDGVDVAFSGPPIGDFYTTLPTVLRGRDAPCIVTLQNGQVDPYAVALAPLGPLADDAGVDLGEYDDAMIEQLSVDGEVYAIPYDATPSVVFYNKEMFADAGVPEPELNWTTEEFVDAAEATTGEGVYGFALGQGITPIATLMTANGESYVGEDRAADLGEPAVAQRLQFLVDLARERQVARPLEASGGSFPDMDQFNTGQAAMSMNGLWALATHLDALGPDNVGVATVPVDEGVSRGYIAGTGFAVTESCSDKAAAFAAVAAMTSTEAQQAVARERNQVPSRADALDAWAEAIGSQEAADVVASLTENGQATLTPVNLNEINTLVTQFQVEAFSGSSTVEEVLAQVEAGLPQ